MANRYQKITSSSSFPAVINQINQNFAKIDAEVTTKQFKDNVGNEMLIGNLQNNQFGMQLFDSDRSGTFWGLYAPGRFAKIDYDHGVPVKLDGMAPDDGRMGLWVAKPGENVLTLLGG